MRLEDYLPINEQEQAIETMLVNAGIDVNDIEFHSSMGKIPVRYVRVGYWKRVTNVPGFKALVSEDHMWDDDCGDLFSYTIKETEEYMLADEVIRSLLIKGKSEIACDIDEEVEPIMKGGRIYYAVKDLYRWIPYSLLESVKDDVDICTFPK